MLPTAPAALARFGTAGGAQNGVRHRSPRRGVLPLDSFGGSRSHPFLKPMPGSRILNWHFYGMPRYRERMVDYSRTSPNPTRPSTLPRISSARIERSRRQAQSKLPIQDSCFACLFLGFYLAAYLAVGFVGVTAVEWAWTRLLG
jgi:hypothetical protein